MYLMFADEADQDAPEKQYLIYGAIYVPTEEALSLVQWITNKRTQFKLTLPPPPNPV